MKLIVFGLLVALAFCNVTYSQDADGQDAQEYNEVEGVLQDVRGPKPQARVGLPPMPKGKLSPSLVKTVVDFILRVACKDPKFLNAHANLCAAPTTQATTTTSAAPVTDSSTTSSSASSATTSSAVSSEAQTTMSSSVEASSTQVATSAASTAAASSTSAAASSTSAAASSSAATSPASTVAATTASTAAPTTTKAPATTTKAPATTTKAPVTTTKAPQQTTTALPSRLQQFIDRIASQYFLNNDKKAKVANFIMSLRQSQANGTPITSIPLGTFRQMAQPVASLIPGFNINNVSDADLKAWQGKTSDIVTGLANNSMSVDNAMSIFSTELTGLVMKGLFPTFSFKLPTFPTFAPWTFPTFAPLTFPTFAPLTFPTFKTLAPFTFATMKPITWATMKPVTWATMKPITFAPIKTMAPIKWG